jgi:hypothetical protein
MTFFSFRMTIIQTLHPNPDLHRYTSHPIMAMKELQTYSSKKVLTLITLQNITSVRYMLPPNGVKPTWCHCYWKKAPTLKAEHEMD